jgi:hypothetical protein
MSQKTNFSFDVHYPAHSDSTPAQREDLMGSLGLSLEQLVQAQDPTASVAVSDSHKGPDNKIVELTTSLNDLQIAELLQAFSRRHGVVVSALE